jgi:hypothetical protein
MLARIMPHLAVISYEEVAPGVEIKSLGTVDIGEPETMGAPGGKTGN